uniref:Uncharacterized protein n=1 Tax=Anopheles minimus TaxID=112268 RepID=A0A182WMP4_9DIPT
MWSNMLLCLQERYIYKQYCGCMLKFANNLTFK